MWCIFLAFLQLTVFTFDASSAWVPFIALYGCVLRQQILFFLFPFFLVFCEQGFLYLWMHDVHLTFHLLKVKSIFSFLLNLKHWHHNKQTVCFSLFFLLSILFRVFYLSIVIFRPEVTALILFSWLLSRGFVTFIFSEKEMRSLSHIFNFFCALKSWLEGHIFFIKICLLSWLEICISLEFCYIVEKNTANFSLISSKIMLINVN